MDQVRNPTSAKGEPVAQWCNLCRPVLEIPEDKDGGSHTANIRATLASLNLPSSSGKENKKMIENYCAIAGKKTIYISKKNVCPVQKDDSQTLKESDEKVAVTVVKKNIKLKKAPAPGKA
mgnify:CR=1 FL=1